MSNIKTIKKSKSKYEEALFLFRKILKTLILSKDENNLLRRMMYGIVTEHGDTLNPKYSMIYESIKAMSKDENGWFKFAKIELVDEDDSQVEVEEDSFLF